jgi:hypothetical protein
MYTNDIKQICLNYFFIKKNIFNQIIFIEFQNYQTKYRHLEKKI